MRKRLMISAMIEPVPAGKQPGSGSSPERRGSTDGPTSESGVPCNAIEPPDTVSRGRLTAPAPPGRSRAMRV